MTPARLPDELAEDASWLAHTIDPFSRLIRLVRMDEEAYRAASFLDDRLLLQPVESLICPLDPAVSAVEHSRDDARWIFHIGHVGSTLLSRLLGEFDGVLSIREPRSLRDLAVVSEVEAPTMAAALRRFMARTFAPGQVALVKATSFVSESAPLLVAPDAAALFMFASPRNYIASILAGANSTSELRMLQEVRSNRLRARGIDLHRFDRSDAHVAAAAWACEMTSLVAAAAAMPDRRVMWTDFDRMLDDMPGWIERCVRHFALAAASEHIEAVVSGPLMQRYSKAMEYDYSPALRAELLAGAADDHSANIAEALAALRDAAGSAPLLAQAIERAEREC
jgi:hypothetical protein